MLRGKKFWILLISAAALNVPSMAWADMRLNADQVRDLIGESLEVQLKTDDPTNPKVIIESSVINRCPLRFEVKEGLKGPGCEDAIAIVVNVEDTAINDVNLDGISCLEQAKTEKVLEKWEDGKENSLDAKWTNGIIAADPYVTHKTLDSKIKTYTKDWKIKLATAKRGKSQFTCTDLPQGELKYVSPDTLKTEQAVKEQEAKAKKVEAAKEKYKNFCWECAHPHNEILEIEGLMSLLKEAEEIDSNEIDGNKRRLKEREIVTLLDKMQGASIDELPALRAQVDSWSKRNRLTNEDRGYFVNALGTVIARQIEEQDFDGAKKSIESARAVAQGSGERFGLDRFERKLKRAPLEAMALEGDPRKLRRFQNEHRTLLNAARRRVSLACRGIGAHRGLFTPNGACVSAQEDLQELEGLMGTYQQSIAYQQMEEERYNQMYNNGNSYGGGGFGLNGYNSHPQYQQPYYGGGYGGHPMDPYGMYGTNPLSYMGGHGNGWGGMVSKLGSFALSAIPQVMTPLMNIAPHLLNFMGRR